MLGLWITILILAFFAGLAIFKSFLKICPPNEILIFSGKTRKLADGTTVGYRIIKGGRALKIPVVETVHRMSLEAMPIEIELKGALANGVIPLNAAAMANIKIAGTEQEGLSNAVERFMGKKPEAISRIARETLEGSMRGVLATLSPEEANTQRIQFAQRVREESAEDFKRLGLVLDTFRVQSITDDQKYLEAIGRKKNAEVQRDARIAEAESESEARKVAAASKKEGDIAESDAEGEAVEARNRLRVKTADLDSQSNAAEARAKLAFGIAEVAAEEDLEDARIKRNKKRYEAQVVIPAEAERQAEELKSQGRATKIREDGKATAEAVKLMREQWEKGHTKELFLIQMLPDIIDKVSQVISDNLDIEKLTVVDGGNGNGMPNVVKGLTGSVVSFMEEMKNATGLDIPRLLKSDPEEKGKLGGGREL